jgi:Ca-activated chloride channel homolog
MATVSNRLTLVLLAMSAGTCIAQGPPTRSEASAVRVDVNLVLVPVTVTDRYGKIITSLDRSRFTVLEDGVPQRIASFSVEDAPVSIGVVLDISGSMKQKLVVARTFVRSLLARMERADEALFLTCADRPDVQADLTRDIDSLETVLQSATPGGWTALVDSVYISLDRIKAARNARKVLVVVSDGQDNHSQRSTRELMSKAIESDVQIYSVTTVEPPGNRKPIELVEENRGRSFLADLARSTGGLYFEIESGSSISAVAEKINRTVHHEYVLGYYPMTPLHNGLRKIQVKLDVPNLRLYARNRYYAMFP